jgi:predicted deacylase
MKADKETRENVLLGLSDPLPEDAKAAGFIRIPYTSNQSAYGFIPVPFAVVGPPDGAQILILAGAHGDESESQVALRRVIADLNPSEMSGRIVALPMANEPAAQAGLRNSPIDGLNLNRAYPGNMFGTPTAVIADYIERHLMAQCEVVLDLHCAGDSFNYLPCTTVIYHPDREERIRRLSLAIAFGAPTILVMHSFEERNSSGAAKRAGAVRFATEISGDITVQMTIDGIMNVLRWAEILPRGPKRAARKSATPAVQVVHPEAHYLYSTSEGLFEPMVKLGDGVASGDRIGFMHDPSRPLRKAEEIRVAASGQVVGLRGLGPAKRGDCLLHLAEDPDADLMAEVREAAQANWLTNSAARRRSRSRAPRDTFVKKK